MRTPCTCLAHASQRCEAGERLPDCALKDQLDREMRRKLDLRARQSMDDACRGADRLAVVVALLQPPHGTLGGAPTGVVREAAHAAWNHARDDEHEGGSEDDDASSSSSSEDEEQEGDDGAEVEDVDLLVLWS